MIRVRQCKVCYTPLTLASLTNIDGINFLICPQCKTRKRFYKLRLDKFDEITKKPFLTPPQLHAI